MTLYYQRKAYSECIYFEENITCLNLMDKYFPTVRLHNLNKVISVYNKVAWEHVYSRSVLIEIESQYFLKWVIWSFQFKCVLVYINTKVLNASLPLRGTQR